MAMDQALVVIPSRLKAARLPNKPLADIHGQPMIVHVWRRAIAANVGPVVVAAGDPEIVEAVEQAGGISLLTDPNLPSGTDRIHAAVNMFDPQKKFSTIINLQGDEPTIDPALIQEVLLPLNNKDVHIGTLANLITNTHELSDPNVVKIALTSLEKAIGRALYFSRNPIPWGEGPYYHHIGIYSYRREVLDRFVRLPQDILEKRESLEQLRALANGLRIDVKIIDTDASFGVDTPADLERARQFIAKNT